MSGRFVWFMVWFFVFFENKSKLVIFFEIVFGFLNCRIGIFILFYWFVGIIYV